MPIQITNLHPGETLTYALPLLSGEIDADPLAPCDIIEIWNNSINHVIAWPVIHGQFKAVVELRPGENTILLKHGADILHFKLNHQVPKFRKFVRPVYIKCRDHDGTFQAPDDEDCSAESAQRRIVLGAQLIQTFTAEKLHEHGLGRKTFQLETDASGKPFCHIFTTALTLEKAHSMSGGDLWVYFAKELMASSICDKDHCKWFAFMSFTRYAPPEGVGVPKSHSDIISYTKGHTALGGGGLALFGTGNLHTWAETVQEVPTRFSDTRKIDRSKFMDDSAYRHYYWANYSTGLGASLHELGHTFDLAHTPTGIMSRGFDDLYRVFSVRQPPCSRSTSMNGSTNGSPARRPPRVSSPRVNGTRSAPQKDSSESPSKTSLESPKLPLRNSGLQECVSQMSWPPSPSSTASLGSPSSQSSPFGSPRPNSIPLRPGIRQPNYTYMKPVPIKVHIETGFQKLNLEVKQSFKVKNYDGSELKTMVKAQHDGSEVVTEVTVFPDGKEVTKETVRPKGKQTPTSSSNENSGSSLLTTSTESTISDRSSPARLPRSPEDGASPQPPAAYQEVKYRDGGAHWYRSSAVLLRYHKWLNFPNSEVKGQPPVLEGDTLKASPGLRLIELRSLPEGVVFHHWEMMGERPPVQFKLNAAEIRELSSTPIEEVTVVAEDNDGNILKSKIRLSELSAS